MELVGIQGYNSLVFAYGPAPDVVLFESQHGAALHALLGDHLNTVRDQGKRTLTAAKAAEDAFQCAIIPAGHQALAP